MRRIKKLAPAFVLTAAALSPACGGSQPTANPPPTEEHANPPGNEEHGNPPPVDEPPIAVNPPGPDGEPGIGDGAEGPDGEGESEGEDEE